MASHAKLSLYTFQNRLSLSSLSGKTKCYPEWLDREEEGSPRLRLDNNNGLTYWKRQYTFLSAASSSSASLSSSHDCHRQQMVFCEKMERHCGPASRFRTQDSLPTPPTFPHVCLCKRWTASGFCLKSCGYSGASIDVWIEAVWKLSWNEMLPPVAQVEKNIRCAYMNICPWNSGISILGNPPLSGRTCRTWQSRKHRTTIFSEITDQRGFNMRASFSNPRI